MLGARRKPANAGPFPSRWNPLPEGAGGAQHSPAGMSGSAALPSPRASMRAVVRQACNRPQGLSHVRAHPMCRPPLQLKSAPVVKPESSPASQAQIEPISSGVPKRLTGIVEMIFSNTSGLIARTMSVPM